jgi:protein-disulfide isomerase-like protein with CxxC motif
VTKAPVEVVEYTDPGCSWAWGTEPKLRRLRWCHGARLRWRRVMGGLIGDMEAYIPGFDAHQAGEHFRRYWAGVAGHTGMPYPAALARMYRSTEPFCRVVKAAEAQGEAVAGRVLRRLREAIFFVGDPPEDDASVRRAVNGVPGLDVDRLLADVSSSEVEERFRADWRETRSPNEYVLQLDETGEGAGRAKESEGHWRYVFPTVIFRGAGGERTVPGWKPYEDYVAALEHAAAGLAAAPRPLPTPAQVLDQWGSAAAHELEVLCGQDAAPPATAVKQDKGGGVLWLSAVEARARGLERPAAIGR